MSFAMAAKHEVGSFALTKNDGFNFSIVWKIENFIEFAGKVGDKIESPPFGCHIRNGARFILRFYPKGKTLESQNRLGLYLVLCMEPTNAVRCLATYQISIIGRDGFKHQTVEILGENNCDREKLRRGYGFMNWTHLSLLFKKANKYLPDGHLTIECVGKLYVRMENPVTELTVRNRQLHSNDSAGFESKHVADNMKNLYDRREEGEIELESSSGVIVKCHKCLLMANSDYFKAMFAHDWKEGSDNHADFSKTMSTSELNDFVEFIYLGRATNIRANCRNLFIVADMIGLLDLKNITERALVDELTAENAIELLVFADKHGASALKKIAASFVVNCMND